MVIERTIDFFLNNEIIWVTGAESLMEFISHSGKGGGGWWVEVHIWGLEQKKTSWTWNHLDILSD